MEFCPAVLCLQWDKYRAVLHPATSGWLLLHWFRKIRGFQQTWDVSVLGGNTQGTGEGLGGDAQFKPAVLIWKVLSVRINWAQAGVSCPGWEQGHCCCLIINADSPGTGVCVAQGWGSSASGYYPWAPISPHGSDAFAPQTMENVLSRAFVQEKSLWGGQGDYVGTVKLACVW